jgi:hypothetical protein
MAPPTTRARANWAVERALALPELWALVAEHTPSLVGKWRLLGVCKASRVGVKESLGTLPGLMVCGGFSGGEVTNEAWRLDLATLRWGGMPALITARYDHACCAVRGSPVVIGGQTTSDYRPSSSVEMFSSGQGAFVELPPVVRRDPGCSHNRGGRERQRFEASALTRRSAAREWGELWKRVDGAPGRSGHRRVHGGAST